VRYKSRVIGGIVWMPHPARGRPRRARVGVAYGPPLSVGLGPEARQALIQERIAKIFEQVWATTDSPGAERLCD
jgi:hypothetical protein